MKILTHRCNQQRRQRRRTYTAKSKTGMTPKVGNTLKFSFHGRSNDNADGPNNHGVIILQHLLKDKNFVNIFFNENRGFCIYLDSRKTRNSDNYTTRINSF